MEAGGERTRATPGSSGTPSSRTPKGSNVCDWLKACNGIAGGGSVLAPPPVLVEPQAPDPERVECLRQPENLQWNSRGVSVLTPPPVLVEPQAPDPERVECLRQAESLQWNSRAVSVLAPPPVLVEPQAPDPERLECLRQAESLPWNSRR